MSAAFVLAFDFGLRHIGVAIGQTVTGTATPLTTLTARTGRPDWPAVLALIDAWHPTVLLVGLPLHMDDTESEMSGRARRFAAALGGQTRLPVHLVDERLTSHASREARSRPGAKDRSHEQAAVLIAETWLQAQPQNA